jgi:4-hydroxybenzoate polyprenyltransferase
LTRGRRRSRWHAYLLLARVSNLPTVWSNVLAGTVAATAAPTIADLGLLIQVAVAVSFFYVGGMFLNDAFDADIDARTRPERPLPSRDVTSREVFAGGAVLLALGMLTLPPNRTAMILGVVLAAAIVFYDFRHKGNAFAPLVMGACRGLVYAIAGAAAWEVTATVIAGGLVMMAYVVALTIVAKQAGAAARWLVPLLIAGISIVDAVFIAYVTSSAALASIAAMGLPLTLLFQRVVPGD